MPPFTDWAQYTRAAREYIPAALGYDEVWTQRSLAALLGVDPNYVAIIERGEKQPGQQFQLTLRYLIRMAAHGIDAREL